MTTHNLAETLRTVGDALHGIAQELTTQRDSRPMLNVAEVQAQLGVTRQTVNLLLRTGELPGIKVRGQWRIAADDFDRYIHGGRS